MEYFKMHFTYNIFRDLESKICSNQSKKDQLRSTNTDRIAHLQMCLLQKLCRYDSVAVVLIF